MVTYFDNHGMTYIQWRFCITTLLPPAFVLVGRNTLTEFIVCCLEYVQLTRSITIYIDANPFWLFFRNS